MKLVVSFGIWSVSKERLNISVLQSVLPYVEELKLLHKKIVNFVVPTVF